MTVDIHSRTEQAVDLVHGHFKTHAAEKLGYELLVEGGGYHSSVRQTESLCAAVETHSGRTVRAAAGRDTELVEAVSDSAESRSRTSRNARTSHALAADNAGELLIAELSDELLHAARAAGNVRQTEAHISCVGYLLRQTEKPPCLLVDSVHRNGLHYKLEAVLALLRTEAFKLLDRSESLLALAELDRIRKAYNSRSIVDIARHEEAVSALLKDVAIPVTRHSGIVIRCELAEVGSQDKGLLLIRSEVAGLLKAAEYLYRLTEPALRVTEPEHNDLFAAIAAGILHFNIYADARAVYVRGLRGDLECCVGKTETERITHLFRRERIEIPVADVDILGVEILLLVTEVLMRGIILDAVSDSIRELAAGTYLSGQDISRADAAGHTSLPHVKERIRLAALDKLEVDKTADVKQYNYFFERRPHLCEHILFLVREQERARLELGVHFLAGSSADDDYGCIALFSRLCNDIIAEGHLLLRPRFSAPAASEVHGILIVPLAVYVKQLLIERDTGFAEPVSDAGHLRHVDHAARASTALVVMELYASENRYYAVAFQRESLVIVAEHYDSLGSSVSSRAEVFIPVKNFIHRIVLAS